MRLQVRSGEAVRSLDLEDVHLLSLPYPCGAPP
jgi:hypothetical protein